MLQQVKVIYTALAYCSLLITLYSSRTIDLMAFMVFMIAETDKVGFLQRCFSRVLLLLNDLFSHVVNVDQDGTQENKLHRHTLDLLYDIYVKLGV